MHRHEAPDIEEMYFAPDALYVLDAGDNIIKYNRGFVDISGYVGDEIDTVRLEDLFKEGESQKMGEAIRKVKENGSASIRTRITRKDGTGIPVAVTGWQIPDSNGSIQGTAWISRKVRPGVRSGSVTGGEKDGHLRRLFDGMTSAFLLVEVKPEKKGNPAEIRFIDFNRSFEKMIGMNRKRLSDGRDGRQPSWLVRYLMETFTELSKSQKTHHFVHYFQEIDTYCEIDALIPVKNRLVLLFTDVTNYKKAEEEKKHLHLQLIQSQKLEGIGRLAGGIAHDFNNLLTAILGYTDLALIQTENPDQLRENLNQIRFATQRAAKLVQQLLIFSRKQPMEFRTHNLSELIENLLKMLKRIIGEDINISLELEKELWPAKIDRMQIEQVILNIAVNARDAMSKGGALIIRTENRDIDDRYVQSYGFARTGRFVCISMKDTGVGMSEETLQKIFEPFFTTKKSGEGTGLGLSMVYGIVKEHRGWITVDTSPGKGSVFKIYLPVADVELLSQESR